MHDHRGVAVIVASSVEHGFSAWYAIVLTNKPLSNTNVPIPQIEI
jgi:hypothetical protein